VRTFGLLLSSTKIPTVSSRAFLLYHYFRYATPRIMARHGGLRKCRARKSNNALQSRKHARWSDNSSCYDAKAGPLRSTTKIDKRAQSSGSATEETPIRRKSVTHTVDRILPSRDSTGEDYRRSIITDYFLSRGIIYLLDNIPRPSNVQFVDQRSLLYAWPQKLLIGHHAHSRDAIHAYLVPLDNSHRVEIYAEHDHGHSRLSLSGGEFARHHILVPFNNTYPRDARKITKTDLARVELLIEWYFIETGVVPAGFRGQGESFCKQLCNALRYIRRRAGPLPQCVPSESPVQTHHRVDIAREKSPSSAHVSEDDIQLSLLQQYCP
jgi:hypothetical protein